MGNIRLRDRMFRRDSAVQCLMCYASYGQRAFAVSTLLALPNDRTAAQSPQVGDANSHRERLEILRLYMPCTEFVNPCTDNK